MKGLFLCALVLQTMAGCTNSQLIDNVNELAFQRYIAKPLYDVNDGNAIVKSSLLDAVLITKQNPTGIVSMHCYTANAGDKTCKEERNIAISTLMLVSEEMCLKHRRDMYGNEAATNLTLGSFTNLFSGAATVISPTTTKTIFSALALFTNAERSLINETVYKQMLVTAIDKKIVDKRETAAININNKMQKPIEQYSISEAMFDVSRFHNNCSFMEGLRYALSEGEGDIDASKAANLKREISEIELKQELIKKEDPLLEERRVTLYRQLNALGVVAADAVESSSATK